MENTTQPAHATAGSAVKSTIRLYAALGTAALLTVTAVAAGGGAVNTFMWVRAVLLPLVAPVLNRLAARGRFTRLRTLTLIMPIAIVGVDLVPGVCPLWYAALQAVCVLPVVRLAVLSRDPAGSGPRCR